MNENKDTINVEQSDKKKLPQMLNVLTILTYIGSGLAFLGGIYSYFTVCTSVEMVDKLGGLDDMEGMNGTVGKLMDSAMEMAHKQCDNRLVILIVTLLAAALCFYGAMQMRNLKKQGFLIYVVGEFLLPIVSLIILGSSALGGMLMLTGLIVPIIFTILYTLQRKHLVN